MKYSIIPSSQTVVYHCKARGIKNIIISPGSRNAPLTIGFTEDPFFNCYSIVDERSAAFFAMGIAQQLKEPAVVLCTSGSALLNYYPAISEAFYSDIPLVVISADRPPYKVDIGDGQTIRQEDVFKNHIAFGANLKLDVSHASEKVLKYDKESLDGATVEEAQLTVQEFNDAVLDKAFNVVFSLNSPIHINVPFEEPLYEVITEPTLTPNVNIIRKEHKGFDLENFQGYLDIWNGAKRKIVLVGVNFPNTVDQKYLEILAKDPSVIVLKECTSNLHHPNFFPSIDSIIAPIEKSPNKEELFKQLQPEVVLTFGGLIVSKKIKAFLREYSPTYHWHIDAHKASNTFFSLTHHFKTEPNTFFGKLLKKKSVPISDYHQYWSQAKIRYISRRAAYMKEIPFSDMLAFNHLMGSIPKKYQLQLGNSSAIRYAQLFDLDASVTVFCNRGTSGIDGSTSTAIGAALHTDEPTLLVSGDLSFLYDSNALWIKYIRPDFRIIVINNGGGGIFRILPGKDKSDNFETFFETTHQIDLADIAKTYNFDIVSVADESSLISELEGFYAKSQRPKILEIKTPRLLNDEILLNYFDFIS
ncbi:2-succinyl-5-enolpyruvyl-6-hydroxy-3-cyclohexene-1-carboxylic-acid synthase [Arenibacter certesii]|uniref:2-succinyl-5-enolpyruvyl-6-hydroxy-3-cyclohexene-1-carboxylate synthase n=1 Tax=Arenibacter certesii TaxID=228955 RepID=A0A918ML41_9FLAO|nr:2-succinyl-5-enolpyruvyl-6-hydroxy-3-cyclohexene-1-carboxylic-acid synthase [Arenibacter certesii]GGW32554.1 2-succinyl-5-enolpyruvyl-6-hydroxy-3-cyclohexene-1-carboxylate synthase [Arenibacter certesii]